MKHDRKKTHVIPNSLDFKIRELCSRFDSESAKKIDLHHKDFKSVDFESIRF